VLPVHAWMMQSWQHLVQVYTCPTIDRIVNQDAAPGIGMLLRQQMRNVTWLPTPSEHISVSARSLEVTQLV
jgi:hypothetical protein